MRTVSHVFCAGVLCAFSAVAAAQGYPTKPVRIISPFGAGGSNDFIARAIAVRMGESMRHQFIVENRAGAGGVIGAEYGAKAAPDGHTLTLISSTLLINAALRPLPIDPIKDFTPIGLVGESPYIFLVNPAVPVKTLRELIELAKRRPNELEYGSAGVGTPGHLAGEMLVRMSGISMTHVPYKSASTVLTELLGGHISTAFSTTIAATQMVSAGKVRPIAVTSAKRVSALPDIPTVAESGVPGYEFSLWLGLAAPAGTPQPIVRRLGEELAEALKHKALSAQLAAQSVDVQFLASEAFLKKMRADLASYAKLVKASGAKAN